ncbi:MAG: DMT family transporter [Anaerotignum sp.]|nr:DMT family transporter [Anaerotignum sp.]
MRKKRDEFMTTQKKKVVGYSLFTILMWASAYPLTKIAQTHFTPVPISFVRSFIAGFLMLIIGRMNGMKLPQKKHIPLFLVSGAFGYVIYTIAMNIGLQTLPSATCSLLVATSPIMTAIIAAKVYNEKINLVSWCAILIAFAGVAILLLWDSRGAFTIDAAMLWMLLSAASWAGYNIMTRKLVALGYTSAQIACYSMLAAAFWLSFSAVDGFRETVTAGWVHIISLLYLAVISNALGCILWGKAMAYAEKTSEVANFMFLSPLLSAMMSFILLKEVPGMGTFIGGVVIISGLLLFNLKGQKKE